MVPAIKAGKLGPDHKIEISSAVIKVIRDMNERKTKSLEDTLRLIFNTFSLANSKRREPKGNVIHFSVNMGDRGYFKLIKLSAITTLNTDRQFIIGLDSPRNPEPCPPLKEATL